MTGEDRVTTEDLWHRHFEETKESSDMYCKIRDSDPFDHYGLR